MIELCILYPYITRDHITQQHFDLLKKLNPEAAVVPLAFSPTTALPDSVDFSNLPLRWDISDLWRSTDVLLYSWFLTRPFSAERYVIIEYDCRCTMPLREAYQDVWDSEVACRSFYTPESKPDWHWFQESELNRLAPEDRIYAAGVAPYTCSLFSHRAMELLIEKLTPNDVFCELRLGTAIRRAGLRVAEFPSPLRDGIFATPTEIDLSKPGVLHPVKARAIHERKMRAHARSQRRWRAVFGRWADW